MKHRLWFAGIALVGAALDLLTKQLVFDGMRREEMIVIIPDFFEFGCTLNKGIVFGIAQGASKIFLWVSILAVPAILAIFWSLKRPRWVMTVSLALILGGTIGNMYDRITEGAVRDFIKFYYPALLDKLFKGGDLQWKAWPLFNLADSCICVGVALLSLEMLFFDEKKRKKQPEPAVSKTEGPVPAATSAPTQPLPPPETEIKVDAPKSESADPQAPQGVPGDPAGGGP